jgi:hypothetical protein
VAIYLKLKPEARETDRDIPERSQLRVETEKYCHGFCGAWNQVMLVLVGPSSKALDQTEAKATEDSHGYWRSLQSNKYVEI